MPPTTSIASSSTPTSSVYWRGFVLPIVWTRSAPADADDGDADDPGRPARPEQVDADRRRGDLVLPRGDGEAPGARLAEPVCDDQRAERGEPQPRVASSRRGTPDSPPAPLVSSCQFFTTWSTTNSTASVIIVAASPPARATATPTTAPSDDGDDARRRRVAPTGPRWTSPSPNGRSGSGCALVADRDRPRSPRRTRRSGRTRGARTTGCR